LANQVLSDVKPALEFIRAESSADVKPDLIANHIGSGELANEWHGNMPRECDASDVNNNYVSVEMDDRGSDTIRLSPLLIAMLDSAINDISCSSSGVCVDRNTSEDNNNNNINNDNNNIQFPELDTHDSSFNEYPNWTTDIITDQTFPGDDATTPGDDVTTPGAVSPDPEDKGMIMMIIFDSWSWQTIIAFHMLMQMTI
jgi:hypothetical protein